MPRADRQYDEVTTFLYLSDVTRENGATALVPRKVSDNLIPLGHTRVQGDTGEHGRLHMTPLAALRFHTDGAAFQRAFTFAVLKPFVEASRCAVGELSAGAVWKLRNGACNTPRTDSGGEAWAAWRQQLRRSATAVANEMANPTAFLDAFEALGYIQSPGEGVEFYKRVDGSISRSRIRALYEEPSALPPPIWPDIAPTRAKAIDSYASLLGSIRSPSFQREYWERRPLLFSRSKERAQRLNRDGVADVAAVLPPLVPSQRWWGDTLLGFQTDALRATFGSPPPPATPDAGTATEPEPSGAKGPTPLDDVTQHYLEEEKHRKQVEGGELLCWPCCKKPEPCSTCSDTWPCWESELDQKEGGRRGGFVYEMPSEQWHHRTASALSCATPTPC